MNKVKLIHTADLHLGANVSMFDYLKNNVRKKEILQTAINIFEACKDVDVMLLPGDIFDNPDCPLDILDLFISSVSKASGTRFFYSCGNHDPYNSKAVTYLCKKCPSNLHIFTPLGECVEIEEIGVRVYGASFDSSCCNESLLKKLPMPDSSFINILCIHGELTESGNSIYNPLSVTMMEEMGFDYAALGHIHSFSGIKKLGNLSYAYSGVHEPNGFDECGKKGYISGEISKVATSLSFVNAAKREYVDESIDITGIKSISALGETIKKVIGNPDNICRLNFVGENSFAYEIDTENIIDSVEAFYLSLSNSVSKSYDFSSFADEVSLRGLCADEVVKRIENANSEEKIIINKAGKLILDILDGRGDGFDY